MVSDTPESVSALEGKRLKEGRAPDPTSPANQGADLYKQYAKDARSGGRALAPSDNPELSPAGAGDRKYKDAQALSPTRRSAQPMSTPPRREVAVTHLPALRRLCCCQVEETRPPVQCEEEERQKALYQLGEMEAKRQEALARRAAAEEAVSVFATTHQPCLLRLLSSLLRTASASSSAQLLLLVSSFAMPQPAAAVSAYSTTLHVDWFQSPTWSICTTCFTGRTDDNSMQFAQSLNSRTIF